MVAAGFTLPTRRFSARLHRARQAVAAAAATVIAPHKASLARLADMPLSVLGFGAVDFAGFHYVHMIGWAVTGLSLFALEHMIADD